MAIPYQIPGVTVQEKTVASPINYTATLNQCLVGPSVGGITVTDLVTFDDGSGGNVEAPTSVTAVPSTTGGFLSDTEYFYVIVAFNANGTTIGSSEVNASISGSGNTGSVTLSWDASYGATGYRVYRGTTTSDENVYFVTQGQNLTTFTDTGSINGTPGTVPVSNTATLPNQVAELLPTVSSIPGATLGSSAIIGVTDATNPALTALAPYIASTDYTFSNTEQTITRTSGSRIPATNSVYVTYTYQTADYFQAALFTNMGDVSNIYGNPFDPTGTVINSPISFGALNAFNNGASQVYLQPLFVLENASDPTSERLQPDATDIGNASTSWTQTYQALLENTDIGIITPLIGQTGGETPITNNAIYLILSAAQDYCYQAAQQNQQYVTLFAGEDGTGGVNGQTNYPDKLTLRGHALNLQSKYNGTMAQNVVFVNSATFLYPMPNALLSSQTLVGGQWVAAALGGLINITSGNVAPTINGASVGGFTAIMDNPKRSAADLLADAQAGMLVLTQPLHTDQVVVRHAITLDHSTIANRELNVVLTKFYTLASVIDTLKNNVIGKIAPVGQDSGTWSASFVNQVLALLETNAVISAYTSAVGTVSPTDPTTVSITFGFSPFFPLLYINITFTINTVTGSITTTSTTSGS